MTRKEISKFLNIPLSSLSDWSRKDENNWRRKLYILLKNMTLNEAERLLEMGDIDNMPLEEMDSKIHLYMEIEDKK